MSWKPAQNDAARGALVCNERNIKKPGGGTDEVLPKGTGIHVTDTEFKLVFS